MKRKDDLKMNKKNIFMGEVYKHFKGGLYTIVTAGTDVDTMENKVVYQNSENGTIWIRNYEEFVGYKEIDGEQVKRFEYVGTMQVEQFFHKE